jgi:hypothetical protein
MEQPPPGRTDEILKMHLLAIAVFIIGTIMGFAAIMQRISALEDRNEVLVKHINHLYRRLKIDNPLTGEVNEKGPLFSSTVSPHPLAK